MTITVPDDTHFGLILTVAAPTANFQAIQGDATELVDSIAPTR